MSQRTRRILFYGLAGLFLVLGIAVIFYSLGWRFDTETLTINKLGAIFFKKIPAGAVVTVEKTSLKFEPGLLDSGLFIANLFPKTYHVTITKAGYQPWEKDVEIKPSLVTEVPPLIFLPEKLEFKKIADGVNDFWFDQKSNIILKTASALYLADIKKQILETISDRQAKNLATKNDAAINQIPLELKKNIKDIKEIKISPAQNKISILTRDDRLYLMDGRGQNLKLLAQNAVQSAFSPIGEKIAFITKNKEVVIYDLQSQKSAPPIILNIGAPAETKIQWLQNSEYLLVQYPESLHLLEANSLPPINFRLISSAVKKFEYSETENLIYLLKNGSLYALELK